MILSLKNSAILHLPDVEAAFEKSGYNPDDCGVVVRKDGIYLELEGKQIFLSGNTIKDFGNRDELYLEVQNKALLALELHPRATYDDLPDIDDDDVANLGMF